MEPVKTIQTIEPRPPDSGEWLELRGRVRHRATEVIDLITILLQDAVILLAGFLAEFAYEHWLRSTHPFFQLAISLSSALFLLLYGITVTVHIVQYVRGQFGAAPASVLGQHLPWALAAAGVIAAAVAVTLPLAHDTVESAPGAFETRFEINTPATSDLLSFALSPNGRQLVFAASGDGPSRLWLRSLETTAAQPLAGTEGAKYPFWSPDSRSIGFFANSQLKRLDLGGGSPQNLASSPIGLGGTWNTSGVILFATRVGSPLFRVSASGGEAAPVTTINPQTSSHRFPYFLPDGRHFLFYVQGTPETSGIYLGALDAKETTRLAAADTGGVYMPSGWVLSVRGGRLAAQRLDLARRVLVGDPVTVAAPVASDPISSGGAVSVSTTGLLTYRPGGAASRRQLTWFVRSGKILGTLGPPDDNDLLAPRLSPDGRRVAAMRTTEGNQDVWLLDGARTTRFTFDAGRDQYAVWSPDGSRIVFNSNRTGSGFGNLYVKPSSGASREELLLESSQGKVAHDWSADGRFLLYHTNDPQTGYDLWVLPLDGGRKPWVFLKTQFQERNAALSPDGRWVAYMSDESGRYEVYVRPFVEPAASALRTGSASETIGGQWQVSTAGGTYARWRADSKELYYLGPEGQMMAAPIVATGTTLVPGTPVMLFPTHILGGGDAGTNPSPRQFDVARDGRFLINTVLDEATTVPITVLQNWQAGLKK